MQFDILTILATQPAAPAEGQNILMQLLPFLVLFAAMYFLLIAPQQRKQKEHRKLLASLNQGDKVMTNGGIYGTVTSVKDDRLTLRIGENQHVEVNRNFIANKIQPEEAKPS